VLPAVPVEAAVLACDTSPSFPGLSTRIGTFTWLGLTCEAAESAIASWSVPAACCDVWIPPPPAVWVADCPVVLALPAVADEAAVLDCVTLPSLPGLRTRIEMFVLLGLVWVALGAGGSGNCKAGSRYQNERE
jgi:hypothetical protein